MMRIINAIIIVFLVSTACFAKEDGPNLIVNGDFEGAQEPVGKPKGWLWFSSDKLAFELSDEKAHSGTQSLKLSAQLIDDGQVGLFQIFPVEVGDKYIFSAYVTNSREEKMKGGFWGSLDIEWLNEAGNEMGRQTGASWNRNLTKLKWKQIETKVKVPKGVTQAKFVIRMMDGKPHGKGACFIDDVVVQKQ